MNKTTPYAITAQIDSARIEAKNTIVTPLFLPVNRAEFEASGYGIGDDVQILSTDGKTYFGRIEHVDDYEFSLGIVLD